MTSSLCPHRHHLQEPSAHPNQEFLDWVWQLLLLLAAVHQHTAAQGKGSEPAAAAGHLCSSTCEAPPLLLPPERCGSKTVSEHLLAETLGDASPWGQSPWESSVEEPVADSGRADPGFASVCPVRSSLWKAEGSSASAPEVAAATSVEHGEPQPWQQ